MSQFILTIVLIFLSPAGAILLYRLVSPYKKSNMVPEWYQWLTMVALYYPLLHIILGYFGAFHRMPDSVFYTLISIAFLSMIIAIDYYLFHLTNKSKWHILSATVYILLWYTYVFLLIITVSGESLIYLD